MTAFSPEKLSTSMGETRPSWLMAQGPSSRLLGHESCLAQHS